MPSVEGPNMSRKVEKVKAEADLFVNGKGQGLYKDSCYKTNPQDVSGGACVAGGPGPIQEYPAAVPPRPKELAEAHWAWVGGLFECIGYFDDVSIMKYVYETAFEHGYKHGAEDVQRRVV